MGKLLKILVVFILLLSIGAAVLAWMNNQKRDVLVGRATIYIDGLRKLAGTLEKDDAKTDDVADFRDRDVDKVEDRELEDPRLSLFWKDYNMALEGPGAPMMDVKRDVLGPYAADEMGLAKADADRAIRNVVKDIQDRAVAQMTALNTTREALKKTRAELVEAIEDVNKVKKEGRKLLVKQVEDEKEITKLTKDKEDLRKQVVAFDRERSELEDQINEKATLVALRDEEIGKLIKDNKLLAEQLEEAKKSQMTFSTRGGGEDAPKGPSVLSSGIKGVVVSVDNQYGIVVVRLSDSAMDELAGPAESRTGRIAEADVMVRRANFTGLTGDGFITKLRLRSIRSDGTNFAVADNLPMWEQAPVAVGDEVFY